MQKVHGIGGFFFRARDPDGLAKWYATHLGVDLTPQTYDENGWTTHAGTTVFQPFQYDTQYFGRPENTWMINFRVRDLAAMMAQLRAAGIEVEPEGDEYPNGKFARLRDPEGNPIQLWEPGGVDKSLKGM